ncbi:DNA mismatch repair endonuclease MutL [Cohnella pontilimi]|uniref:DNA mismatch repair protein MutL n=1 Tax=Cohnella pontilimi TaxID=2564100 RepID=A0A4U0FIG6_9BACL|nr:DNA mismatch repair endonuclease MutL [Cohnella pontilimi]TJY44244.1 DNA mismatch repair endonuclease MutL [Cohnella pontilimi]
MGIIRPLDEHLANQIAAGEVVERPASVLKELIENAVDAGSTRIDISAEEGGLTLLRVADDGLGMAADDLMTAFQRHATSKISTAKDLFQIATLGFRGEALPSIAAVAKIRCVSALDGSGLARFLEIEGGVVKGEGETNAPQGTEMTVRDLFYNTPARLKYMKTIQTELGHLSDVVYRQALSRPDIAFTFRHNGSVLLRTAGTGDLKQVVAGIYGTAAAKAMLEVKAEHLDYSLTGVTALPVETRANRNAVTVLVNGRYVRSQAVVQPLLQAYHTLLPLHRFPLSVLHLRMHPTLVDVNVHPAKLEVRFSKENELRTFIEQTVKEALGGRAYIPSATAVRTAKQPSYVQDQIRFQVPVSNPMEAVTGAAAETASTAEAAAVSESTTPRETIAETRIAYPSPSVRTPSGNPQAASASGRPSAFAGTGAKPDFGRSATPEKVPDSVWQAAFAAPPEDKQAEPKEFPDLHWIGQLHGTYIVAQNETGLYLIDQHAAHERINYEFYYDKFGRPEEASQELLLPVTLAFAPDEYAVLRERLPMFESAGVYLEEFGGNTFIVRAVPHWFPQGDEADIVREIADWVLTERKIDLHALREKAAILCSCKASIKANQAQTREAGERLLARLGQCRQPYTCPHGRPIVVSFSTYELEKMFKRVM